MESSDEFAWTDASQDSVRMNENGDDDSESGYSYKKKLQNELFNHNQEISSEGTNAKKKSKKRKHSDLESSNVEEPKSKHIKTEPESDLDIKPKKKKSKTSICESALHDEEFLNLKVKEETMSTEWKSPKPKKKKNHRKNSDGADCSSFSESQSQENYHSQYENDTDANLEINIENDYSNLKEELVDNENFKTKKKKSKKKKEKESIENTIIEDKFSAEETIVEQRVQNVHESLSIIEEKSKRVKRTSESTDKIGGNVKHDRKQSFTADLENNTSNTETSQLNKSKNTNEMSTLFDNVAPTDEILSSNGNISLSQPVRKIADRIRFEDDTLDFSHEEAEGKGVRHSTSLQKFLKRNAHLTPIMVTQNTGSVITDEDEVWVLKCPSEVDIKSLKNTSFVLDNKCKLKAESQTYIGFIENYTDRMSVLTLNQNVPVIKNIPLSGIIQFSKRIPKPHYIEDNNIVNNQTNFIPLPDTKSRHPLFGVNYKSAIKIPKHISKRLNGLTSEIIPEDNEKRKKKKKKHKKEVNVSEDEQEMKVEPEREPLNVHKKRKRKHSHHDETSPKLAKRLKHDPDSTEAWESEKAIEEQLFNF